jgi:soluble lytic murein transglycosylase-like protein
MRKAARKWRGAGSRRVLGLAILGSIVAGALRAEATVYMYKDAEGVSHFSDEPVPGSVPFVLGVDRAQAESEYEPIIRQCAAEYSVEAALVKAVIRAESGFDSSAVSDAGAQGLMQLMPETARHHGVAEIDNPHENIRGGVRHLRALLDRFHDTKLALAAYNAGAGVVVRYRGVPPYRETRTYVAKVLRLRRHYLRQERST